MKSEKWAGMDYRRLRLRAMPLWIAHQLYSRYVGGCCLNMPVIIYSVRGGSDRCSGVMTASVVFLGARALTLGLVYPNALQVRTISWQLKRNMCLSSRFGRLIVYGLP